MNDAEKLRKKIAKKIAAYLFTNGIGQQADFLRMFNQRNENLGGWSQRAVELNVLRILEDEK